MGIGRSIGYQYNLPQGGLPQDQIGGGAIRGGLGTGGQIPGQGGIPVPEGLQWVDDKTGRIYQKWGELNNFAKSMKTQYGMDVTDPDYTDPQQVQIAQAYQKGVADLYMNIDKFRNSQQMIADFNKRGGDFSESYDPNKPFAEQLDTAERRPIEDETKLVLQDYQQAFTDFETARAATDKLTQYKEDLEERLSVTTNQSEKDMLNRSISAIKGALYDSTEDLNRLQRKRALDLKLADRDAQIEDYWDRMKKIQGGDEQMFKEFSHPQTGRDLFKDVVMTPDGKVRYKAIEFAEEDPESGKWTIEYGDEQVVDPNTEAGQRKIANQLRDYGDYKELLWAYAKNHRSREGTAMYAPTRVDPIQRAETADVEAQRSVNLLESISNPPSSGVHKDIKAIVPDLKEKAKQGTLKLTKGIPMRRTDVIGRVLDAEGDILGFSKGGEEIVEIDDGERWWGNKGGITLKDKDGNFYFIPASKSSREGVNRALGTEKEGLGKFDQEIYEFLKLNQLGVDKKEPTTKVEPKAEQTKEVELSTIVVDDMEAIQRPSDKKIKIRNKKNGKTGWSTVDWYQKNKDSVEIYQ